jgi:DNA-binding transcriptional LysR family regulator
MDRLADLEAFLAIVELGSQTAAAKQLNRSLQSINRSLAALESSTGAELVRRSTRRSNPTEAGLRYYRRIRPAFHEIDAARRELTTKRAEPSGVLRIAAPVLFASTYVAPAVCEFLARYPHVEVTLTAADRKVDMYEGRYDLAVRIRELPDSGLKARRLGELRVVTFGSPRYFAARGRPKHPSELEHHECIVRSTDPEAEKWWFRVRGKREFVRVGGRFRTDDARAAHAAVVAGLGIGMAPLWHVQSLISERQVELVLEEFEVPKLPIVAVSPATKQPRAIARLFTDLLAARLKGARGLWGLREPGCEHLPP